MAKIKEIRNRIKSVKATHKITSTMEMVAAGRMKRAMNRMLESRPFMEGFTDIVGELVAGGDLPDHPLLAEPKETRREAVVVLSSNRGLCGAFNTNIFRRCMEEVRRIRDEGREVEIHTFGKKVSSLLRFQGEAVHAVGELPDRPVFADAERIADALVDRFQAALQQPPESMQLLPIDPSAGKLEEPGAAAVGDVTIYSPERASIFTALLPLYLRSMVLQALLETTSSEQVARRNAMKNATENAEDMIKNLTRKLNKVRQAAITRELAEIVGGAQAVS